MYFDIDMADDGNINMLLSDLEAYYADGLGQSVDRVAELDADKLSKDKDHGQLQRLAELVLGAATLCEDNAEYVRTIMEMPADHQRCLAPIIEQAMAAAHGHGEDDRIGRSDSFHSAMSDDDMDGKSHGSGGRGRSASGVSDGAADRRVLTLEIENVRGCTRACVCALATHADAQPLACAYERSNGFKTRRRSFRHVWMSWSPKRRALLPRTQQRLWTGNRGHESARSNECCSSWRSCKTK